MSVHTRSCTPIYKELTATQVADCLIGMVITPVNTGTT